jgi:steroid 5-alpha reductase family enzyme
MRNATNPALNSVRAAARERRPAYHDYAARTNAFFPGSQE